MAIPVSVSALNALMAKRAPQAIYTGYTQATDLLALVDKVRPSNPDGPRWQEKTTANTSPARFTVGGALPAASAYLTSEATLGWGNYFGSVKLADRQIKQIEEAGNLMLIESYLASQIADAVEEIFAAMQTDAISGTSTDGLIGIGSAIDDGNIYAGIDRSTVTNFRSYVNDNNGGGNRTTTAALMGTVYNTLRYTNRAKAFGPRMVWLTGATEWEVVGLLSTGAATTNVQVQYTQGVSQITDAVMPRAVGASSVAHKGVPVIAIAGYTANRMDLVDLDALKLEVLGQIDIKEPEVDGDSYVWKIFTYAQLRLCCPRKCAASLQEVN